MVHVWKPSFYLIIIALSSCPKLFDLSSFSFLWSDVTNEIIRDIPIWIQNFPQFSIVMLLHKHEHHREYKWQLPLVIDSILTTCGPIHSWWALAENMLPCLVIHQNLSVLLHEHTQSVRFHMSFTYCIFCEVCKLWPCSSLQEIAERNVGPLLY